MAECGFPGVPLSIPASRWTRALGWLAAGAVACASVARAPARPLPDSFEMLAVGRCSLGLGECGGLDTLWWPPLYGWIAALLAEVLPTGAALVLPALLPMALLAVPVVSLSGRLGGTTGAALGGVALSALPVLHTQAMTADARGLALALAAGAWTLATGGGEVRRATAAGVLAGLAVLARPEALVAALAVPVVAGLRWRTFRAGIVAATGAALTAGPWWAALSLDAGGLRLRPRTVESWAVPLLEVLPKAEVVRLIGASAGGTPFRTAAEAAGPAPGTAALDLSGGIAWLADQGPEAVGALLWVLPVALALLLRRRHGWTLLALAGLAAPAVGAALVPQGRDALAPLANLLPVAIVAAVLTGAATGAAIDRWVRSDRQPLVGAGLAVGLALVAGVRSGSTEPPLPGIETTAPGRAAVAALGELPAGSVQATFESVSLVHLAGRPWVPWPDPWLPRRSASDVAVVTDLDPAWRLALQDPAWRVVHLGGDDRGWAAVLLRQD